MDPALAAFDIAKAGAILADMVISYLAPGASSSDPEEEPDSHEDRRSAPVAAGLHLHPSVNAGSGAVQSGEHGPTIQSDEQGPIARLEPGADSGARSRSWSIRGCREHARGFQEPGWRRGDGPRRCDLLPGSVAIGAVEPRLASPARTLCDHRYAR